MIVKNLTKIRLHRFSPSGQGYSAVTIFEVNLWFSFHKRTIKNFPWLAEKGTDSLGFVRIDS